MNPSFQDLPTIGLNVSCTNPGCFYNQNGDIPGWLTAGGSGSGEWRLTNPVPVFPVFPSALLQGAWGDLSPAFMGGSRGSWIMVAVCATSSGCRAPAGKSADAQISHCARLFRGESDALSVYERRPQSSQGKLAGE